MQILLTKKGNSNFEFIVHWEEEKRERLEKVVGAVIFTNFVLLIVFFSTEHNLPDNPFASPTKSAQVSDSDSFTLANEESSLVPNNGSSNSHLIASTLLPPPLENMASFNSCFFQIPRYSHVVSKF